MLLSDEEPEVEDGLGRSVNEDQASVWSMVLSDEDAESLLFRDNRFITPTYCKCECNGVCCCVYTSIRLVVVFIVVFLSVCVRSSTDSSVMSDWGAENPVVSAAAVRKSSRKRY